MNKDKIIKLLGATLIAVGSLQLTLRAKDIWWSLAMLFRPASFVTIQEYLVYSGASLFFFIVLPLAIFIAGVGMVKTRRWGWLLAVIVCTITFIVKVAGAVRFAIAVHESRTLPIPAIPEGAYVGVAVSLWPTYIYAVTSALFILLLTRTSIKTAFPK
ncbi:MAG: hypothetical protein A2X56_03490 [Nitrospirae bacterium GWC2_57_13]|jgi:NADH:ubiquinone oxidoreductase subunit 6 (subunit J)|nr:MAG: hypothetical protein A2072_08635 [Nitrospirae bacterium GWC1_57_7]OGW28290.1 MAG: hypothetical protein A2X56_03490 [Nitrospirae bacterium GWC2_57_13]OGW40639.1 MAG: hypothetical protein A2X57_03495 [Nitrospirae bacterium GWD2_57_8]HAS54204.1 hypothetical protein [Nitrospiraceae bacterium]